MSGATPITVNHSTGSLSTSRNRLPIGSASGQNFLAIVSLTTATAVRLAPSASVKSRPFSIARPIVFCRCGVTPMKLMNGSSPLGTVRPSTITLPPPPPASSGMKFEANALWTPGNPSMRRTMSSTRWAFGSSSA
ncbi:MAG: hypothetical protein A3J29_03570 [Acidobacteria bacterium RIFCSPLOWO2_12_FULL_67_14b]|nr:MAG: hypothetical protein A3J29_03570 [Acidobacteria bacterium RIFCSPLOWO2_12_FULL_67_14b]